MSNFILTAEKHASIIKSVIDSMSRMYDGIGPDESDGVQSSSLSILAAATVLRIQASSAKKQCEYLQGRVRNQSSVVRYTTPTHVLFLERLIRSSYLPF